MTENINALIKLVERNNKVVRHQLIYPNLEVYDFFCSTYIQKQGILVKGEYGNLQNSRNAILVFFDLQTHKVKGGFQLLKTISNKKALN